ncbi:hypothetical protein PGB90_001749 [Kerria lacca]
MSSSNVKTILPVNVTSFWIFGYGSLCWNPGFTFKQSCIGYVKGFCRKFWQGSISHRGTKTEPGRVATLIEDEMAVVWGRAFEITSESDSFRYLQTRECSNGGYLPEMVTFYPTDDTNSSSVQAITFIAYSDNCFWLGDAPLMEISSQISRTKGIAGHNAEYLLKLADYIRKYIPQDQDDELFALEILVLEQLKRQKLNLNDVMVMDNRSGVELEEQIIQSTIAEPRSSDDFTHRVPDKKLRCVNI